jgi:uncharacterized membrane protein YbaN (DUF454 family)
LTKPRRIALLLGGFAVLALAIVGALLPVMPATPFVVLAAYCFGRSSERWHAWLTANRLFGRYVAHVVEGRPLSSQVKAVPVGSCWVTGVLSAVLLAPNLAIKLCSLSVAAAMTAYVLLRGRRQREPEASASQSPST